MTSEYEWDLSASSYGSVSSTHECWFSVYFKDFMSPDKELSDFPTVQCANASFIMLFDLKCAWSLNTALYLPSFLWLIFVFSLEIEFQERLHKGVFRFCPVSHFFLFTVCGLFLWFWCIRRCGWVETGSLALFSFFFHCLAYFLLLCC